MAESSGRRFGRSGGSGIDDGTVEDPMEAEIALDERRSARNMTRLQVLVVLRKNVSLRRRSDSDLFGTGRNEV